MNEPILQQCLRMLGERAEYFDRTADFSSYDMCKADAYNSAYTMLQYALDGDREALNNFDYYGE